MVIFKTIEPMQVWLGQLSKRGSSIGFVPTMGALHDGHLSLVKECKKLTDICVVSIFVNPTQFNDPEDLKKYPRNTERDIDLLIKDEVDVLFLPDVSVMYPSGTDEDDAFDLQGLDLGMEGAHRPGHFSGVVQVVKRLLDAVRPDHLFMGQKDFQQYSIIKHFLRSYVGKVNIHMVSTVREPDGLAMSSRNVRLSDEQRKQALVISATLDWVVQNLPGGDLAQIRKQAVQKLDEAAGVDLDYLEIADPLTLKPIEEIGQTGDAVICAAAFVGPVRLIDNMLVSW